MNPPRALALTAFLMLCFCRLAAGGPANVIIDLKNNYILGALDNGKWLDSAKAGALLKEGTSFRAYGLDREMGSTKAGTPESMSEPCPDTWTVKLSPPREEGAIALSGSWNALPRKPRSADVTQPVYVQAVREFLQTKGLKDPEVHITQILRVDLDGDKEEEVLISATNYLTKKKGMPSSATAGSYSFVLLRRVVEGKVKTQSVEGEFYPKQKEFNAPSRYRVLAVLDLDGDGKMEVIVDSEYYEGGATTIYRCTPEKIEELISTGCGA
ncbi:MAG TPA: FG-GAP repeat protein [Chthoniobacterales bacterium]|nr:FG-GAP repeat protein [Chthoniobacterales bacterium]